MEKTKNCPFCCEIFYYMSYVQHLNEGAESVIECQYKVSLVSETYLNGNPASTFSGPSHELNFCPVCGAALYRELKRSH